MVAWILELFITLITCLSIAALLRDREHSYPLAPEGDSQDLNFLSTRQLALHHRALVKLALSAEVYIERVSAMMKMVSSCIEA